MFKLKGRVVVLIGDVEGRVGIVLRVQEWVGIALLWETIRVSVSVLKGLEGGRSSIPGVRVMRMSRTTAVTRTEGFCPPLRFFLFT